MKNNDYGKRLFAGTVAIYFDLFLKYLSTSDQNYHILKVVSVRIKIKYSTNTITRKVSHKMHIRMFPELHFLTNMISGQVAAEIANCILRVE